MKRFNPITKNIKFKEISRHFDFDHPQALRNWVGLALVLGFISLMLKSPATPELRDEAPSLESLDIYIPENHSLVPISVANYESLDQVIGMYGVVDLYSLPLRGHESPHLVASAVKLVRSGKSQRHFNVLIHKDDAGLITGHHGEFNVSVRNPKEIGTKIVKKKQKRSKSRIIFQTE
jgi:hypothetical protein